jgi:molybdopterin molybdotransferase
MFFKVKTSEEVFQLLERFGPVGEESVPLEQCAGRILSEDIHAPEDLPGFPRSSMDGYAVKARDTFGASESLPVMLEVAGEVMMGQPPPLVVRSGQTARISTGGMIPEGADCVVMIEYCHPLDRKTIEIARAASPLENVILPDDDFKKGALVLKRGSLLRPQDVGVLAGLGLTHIPMHKRPKVAIISTGDEVIPVHERSEAGKIRDINSYTMTAFCQETGAEPVILGLCPDDPKRLKEIILQGLDSADTVWISGGSSVGTRDITLNVLESFDQMELLVHGISISPGKPTIIAQIGSRAVFGLPGHTTSAMVVAEIFLVPFLNRLSGVAEPHASRTFKVEAELTRNIESASGREDYIRVTCHRRDGRLQAEPLFGKSGLISTLVEAHGLVRVNRDSEGLYEGQKVKVMIWDHGRGALL